MTTARSQPALRVAVASGVDLAAAIDAFLSQPDLASTTRAKYRQTLTVLEDELGDSPVTGPSLAGVVAQRWHHASPATWNRHVATVRSFARYWERTRILGIDGDVELQRRAEKHDHTRSIPLASLERPRRSSGRRDVGSVLDGDRCEAVAQGVHERAGGYRRAQPGALVDLFDDVLHPCRGEARGVVMG